MKLSESNPSAFLACLQQNFCKFLREQGLSPDWHNAKDLGVTAEVAGNQFMGEGRGSRELVVVLRVQGQERHRITLASLLALASKDHA